VSAILSPVHRQEINKQKITVVLVGCSCMSGWTIGSF